MTDFQNKSVNGAEALRTPEGPLHAHLRAVRNRISCSAASRLDTWIIFAIVAGKNKRKRRLSLLKVENFLLWKQEEWLLLETLDLDFFTFIRVILWMFMDLLHLKQISNFTFLCLREFLFIKKVSLQNYRVFFFVNFPKNNISINEKKYIYVKNVLVLI